MYIKLIRPIADLLNNKQIVDDPSVKQFNVSLNFLWRITRAISEYFVMLSKSAFGPDLDMLHEFERAAELNSDFAWLFHFLYDFAYLVLDFKQSVRSGDGDALDILWREFFASGHCSSANTIRRNMSQCQLCESFGQNVRILLSMLCINQPGLCLCQIRKVPW